MNWYLDENGQRIEDLPGWDRFNDLDHSFSTEPYVVSVSQMDDGWHVAPVRGLMSVGYWGLTNNPKRTSAFWTGLLGLAHRYEYPKTRKQLERSIARCVEWCRRMNAHTAAQRAIGEEVMS